MSSNWIVVTLLAAGTCVHAAPAVESPAAATPAVPAQAAPEKSKLEAYADKERTELHSFVESAKAELDKFEQKESNRLEAVAKRAAVEPFAEADQTKINSLQDLMTSSSAEIRKKALSDLKDKLRAQKAMGIWSKYKVKKKALWVKLQQDWQKLLTQPPLMIRGKLPAAPAAAKSAKR